MLVRWKRRIGVTTLVAAAMAGAGCRPRAAPRPAPTVARVVVVPSAASVPAGDKVQLAAEADDADGNPVGGAELRFAISDPRLLSISSNGLVTSRGALGSAEVVVSSGGKQARARVRVLPGPPGALSSVSGDGQSAPVGTALPKPIVVRVNDDKHNPVSGVTVAFAPPKGGIADPATVTTDAQGEASSRWTLGPGAGAQELKATVQGAAVRPVVFRARADSGPVAQIAEVADPAPAVAPGEERTVQVRLTDAEGNPTPNVTVHWRVDAGEGRLSSEAATSDETGVARVIFATGRRSGANRVMANAGDITLKIEVATRAVDEARPPTPCRSCKKKRPAARARH